MTTLTTKDFYFDAFYIEDVEKFLEYCETFDDAEYEYMKVNNDVIVSVDAHEETIETLTNFIFDNLVD